MKPTLADLFLSFARVGLCSFGGATPWVRKLIVDDQKWMTDSEFASLLGLCQLVPGPAATNLTLCVGMRLHGWQGALSAASGLLFAPVILACTLAAIFDAYGASPTVQAATHGMAAAGVGLLLAVGIKLAEGIKKEKSNWLLISAIALVSVGGLGLPALPVLLGLLVVGAAYAWHRFDCAALP